MTTRTWARLEGQRIAAVAESASAPAGAWVDITGVWPGWGARPAPTHSPYLQSGAVVWQDATTERVAAAWAAVRAKRNALLAASDWIVTRAIERGEAVPAAWLAYRQALRDITLQADPFNIVWPPAPAPIE